MKLKTEVKMLSESFAWPDNTLESLISVLLKFKGVKIDKHEGTKAWGWHVWFKIKGLGWGTVRTVNDVWKTRFAVTFHPDDKYDMISQEEQYEKEQKRMEKKLWNHMKKYEREWNNFAR